MTLHTGDYCSFEKAAEHLADRWIFLIGRELALRGPLGFNAIADSLPGISRSVLARRLRKLQDFGLVARDPATHPRQAAYRLAPAGLHLVPMLTMLNEWAERWIPEDPSVIEHDPEVINFWLTLRLDRDRLPTKPAVLVLQVGGPSTQQAWLVLQHGAEPSLCIEDPLLPAERYLYVEADAKALLPIARGQIGWTDAIKGRTVDVYADPQILEALPTWFQPTLT